MMMKDEEAVMSRVERSLRQGYWYFPMEPTSDEICTALRARENLYYEDGYPDNLVSLNRFFVMHKVGYRNGKGVKLEGWKTYDDHLMTKTSSGPLNGNDNLVLRIFALRPVIKGVEPRKLCWVKELSKGHQSGRRKKFQPEDENNPHKRMKASSSPYTKSGNPHSPSQDTISIIPYSPPNNGNGTGNNINPYHESPTSQELHPLTPNSISKHGASSSLPGLHVTLASLAETLAPIHLPPLDPSAPNPSHPSTIKSEIPYLDFQPQFKNAPLSPNSQYYHSPTQKDNRLSPALTTATSEVAMSSPPTPTSVYNNIIFHNSSPHTMKMAARKTTV